MNSLAGFVPIRVHSSPGGLGVDWCHLGERRFTDPFFRFTIEAALREPFNLAFRPDTPIETLEAFARESPGVPPTAFVYHASRCGSTLIARMLMALRTHVVLSEPTLLEPILHHAPNLPTLSRGRRIALLRALLSALGQPRAGGETRLVVKLDAWDVVDVPLIRDAFPEVPWIFLYRDPLEIAVSQMRAPGAHMVPGLLVPTAEIVAREDALSMSREDYVVRVLGRILEAGARHCAELGGRPVHYEELPDAVTTTLAAMLGIDPDNFDDASMADLLVQDAKTPQLRFARDSERKRAEASPALREAVARHAAAPYRMLEALRKERTRAAAVSPCATARSAAERR